MIYETLKSSFKQDKSNYTIVDVQYEYVRFTWNNTISNLIKQNRSQ